MSIRLIGMVHLGPLPGAPHFDGDLERVIDGAVRDAASLTAAGFDALLIENFGDAPFYADDVPKLTVAAMARAVTEVRRRTELPIGVNVLRNDARAALAIAAVCGGQFIRVNVLSGIMFTDQGTITGPAAELARMRGGSAPGVEVYADVLVKHATPPPGSTLAQTAADTYRRGGADALIVSGSATGEPPDPAHLAEVRAAVPESVLLAGSGVSMRTVADLRTHVDGVIVGTALKVGGETTAPVDPDLAAQFVRAARAD